MNEYRIAVKIPRDHLWYGGYFRDLILKYFELDDSELADECRLCYSDDFITHTYIFSPADGYVFGRPIDDWVFDCLGDYLDEVNAAENPITPGCYLVRRDIFSYEIVIGAFFDEDEVA